MSNSKVRQQIAWQAARLLYSREETEYYRAKMKAARYVQKGWVKPADLPGNAEIRDQVRILAQLHEGQRSSDLLLEMRMAGLRMMRLLARFAPKLIGSVLTGHIRQGSDIDLHVFADSAESVRAELEYHGIFCDLERKRVVKGGNPMTFQHLRFHDRFPIELTVYPTSQIRTTFVSSITGKPMERASLSEFEQRLKLEYPDLDLEQQILADADAVDRFQLFYALLLPLEDCQQDLRYHPEGDVLYHSLQVFDLAMDQLPYDEEFLLAALLHDVGKGIDPADHVTAGLDAIRDYITPRTAWLIQNHMEAHKIADGSIGRRARSRLQTHESFDELMLLQACDRAGRVSGIETTSLEDALDYLRQIADQFTIWKAT
ncbi:MAG: HD domain-containing protein [Planctomycetaceae bacterium]|nr:HD domain-containing protein [Planctomycetaceae bacterium]